MKNILFCAGSTGGHFYPAYSIIQNLNSNNYFLLLPINSVNISQASELEQKFKIQVFYIKPFYHFYLKNLFSNISVFFSDVLFVSSLIDKLSIDVVITLGSSNSIPAAFAAKLKNKKLIIMEQNVLVGKANKLLANFADIIILPFKESLNHINKIYHNKSFIFPNPLRKEFYLIDNSKTNLDNKLSNNSVNLLFIGGSLGAKSINELALKFIDFLLNNSNFDYIKKIFLISGKKNYNEIKDNLFKILQTKENLNYDKIINQNKLIIKIYGINNYLEINVLEYVDEIIDFYLDSDIVISRSGGIATTEILYLNKNAILIPYPYAADNHQYYNALTACKYNPNIDIIIQEKNKEIDINHFVLKLQNNIQKINKNNDINKNFIFDFKKFEELINVNSKYYIQVNVNN
ncbi:MAG: UDP-N-acetylglucosamine--N-acetylmuramyl-(pentapeptide) pyrophosphoryl-undecaprenol N-acetylglucosamine transferase [bacterium]|jgi:UDP-N-acetylglucosamine--N-acetylmuramyl-(pentapeptide) pyrophosphoryl-undecaprenol N-acetylglucosamine transferase